MSFLAQHIPARSAADRWPGQFHWYLEPRIYAKGKKPLDLPLGDMEVAGLRAWCPCGCGRSARLPFREGAHERWNGNLERPSAHIYFESGCGTSWLLSNGYWMKLR